jgi:hypothetical protein
MVARPDVSASLPNRFQPSDRLCIAAGIIIELFYRPTFRFDTLSIMGIDFERFDSEDSLLPCRVFL